MNNIQRDNNISSNAVQIQDNNELPKKPKESNNNPENKENRDLVNDKQSMNDDNKRNINEDDAPPTLEQQFDNQEFNIIKYEDNRIKSVQEFIEGLV